MKFLTLSNMVSFVLGVLAGLGAVWLFVYWLTRVVLEGIV